MSQPTLKKVDHMTCEGCMFTGPATCAKPIHLVPCLGDDIYIYVEGGDEEDDTLRSEQ